MAETKINYKQRAERLEQLCKMFHEIYKSKVRNARSIRDKILLRESVIFGDLASIAERWGIKPESVLMVLDYEFKSVEHYEKVCKRRGEQLIEERKAERKAERRNKGEE